MTNILGTITDSVGTPLDGTLKLSRALLSSTDVTSPDTIYTTEPKEYPITSGVLDIDVPESETQKVLFNFEFTKTGDTEPLFSINEIIPNVGTVEFSTFLPSGITTRNIDTGALSVARILANDDALSQLVKQPATHTVEIDGATSEQTFYLPKPFSDAVVVKTLAVFGISGYEDWEFSLGVINSSGNESELTTFTTSTVTQNGRRLIRQTYDESRAASIMGLYMRATPTAATSLTATLSISYMGI